MAEEAPNSSIAREIVAGLAAAAIALVCGLPPLLHLVTGPLGPLIGGAVVAYHQRPGARGGVVIALTLGLALAAVVGGGILMIVRALDRANTPNWFPLDDAGLIVGAVLVYATALGFAGVALGQRLARDRER